MLSSIEQFKTVVVVVKSKNFCHRKVCNIAHLHAIIRTHKYLKVFLLILAYMKVNVQYDLYITLLWDIRLGLECSIECYCGAHLNVVSDLMLMSTQLFCSFKVFFMKRPSLFNSMSCFRCIVCCHLLDIEFLTSNSTSSSGQEFDVL